MRKNITHAKYDFFYSSVFFFKFLNRLLKSGKRHIIEKIVYGLFIDIKFLNLVFKQVASKVNYFPIYIYFEVISICRPFLSLRLFKASAKFRKGNKKDKKQIALTTKVIPLIISRQKSYKIVIGWLINAIKLRNEIGLKNRIIGEFKDIIFEKQGYSLKKKEQLRSLLILNRSLLHYRWVKD